MVIYRIQIRGNQKLKTTWYSVRSFAWFVLAVLPVVAQGGAVSTGGGQEDEEEVVVEGSLFRFFKDALEEKQTSDIILDSVVSEDIGKFPDVSIADAIARLPGVSVIRDRGGNASEISVRGLGPNLSSTLLNGREVAAVGPSRHVQYDSFPAELLDGAGVYKSPKPSTIEGGIGGTVDLRTLRPLDYGERKVVFDLRGSYFDNGSDIRNSDDTGYVGTVSVVHQLFDDTLGIAFGASRRDQPILTARTNFFPYTGTELQVTDRTAFNGVLRAPGGRFWYWDPNADGGNGANVLAPRETQLRCFRAANDGCTGTNPAGGEGYYRRDSTFNNPAAIPNLAGGVEEVGPLLDSQPHNDRFHTASRQPAEGEIVAPTGFEALLRNGNDQRDGLVGAVQWTPTDEIEAIFDIIDTSVSYSEHQYGFRANNAISLPRNHRWDGLHNRGGNVIRDARLRGTALGSATIIDHLEDWPPGIRPSVVNERWTSTDDFFSTGLNLQWERDRLALAADLGYSKAERDGRWTTTRSDATLNGERVGVNYHTVDGRGVFRFFRVPDSALGVGGPASDPDTALTDTAVFQELDLTDEDVFKPAALDASRSVATEQVLAYAVDGSWDLDGLLDGLYFHDVTAMSFGLRYSDREKEFDNYSEDNAAPVADDPATPDVDESSLVGRLGTPTRAGGNFASSVPAILWYDLDEVIRLNYGGFNYVKSEEDRREDGTVEEKVLAGYVAFDMNGDIFNLPYSGNMGVRVARTHQTSAAMRSTGFGDNAEFIPFSVENNYTDILPSVNVSFSLTNAQILRFAASRALTRAPLDDLQAGVGEFDTDQVSDGIEAFGGNPDLKPWRSTQVDFSYENYYADGAALAISGFHKSLSSFVVRLRRTGQALPSGRTGTIVQPVNGSGGRARGFEVAWTQPLKDYLPGIFSGFGLYGNYTRIDSQIGLSPAYVTGEFSLPGLPENSFYASLWYSYKGVDWSLGYWYRDPMVIELGDVPDQLLFSDRERTVDFQASYTFQEQSVLRGLRVHIQAKNLTNEPFRTYYGDKTRVGRYEEYGRRFWAGLRYEF